MGMRDACSASTFNDSLRRLEKVHGRISEDLRTDGRGAQDLEELKGLIQEILDFVNCPKNVHLVKDKKTSKVLDEYREKLQSFVNTIDRGLTREAIYNNSKGVCSQMTRLINKKSRLSNKLLVHPCDYRNIGNRVTQIWLN